MGYEAYVLTESARQRLAEAFPPKYSEWIGHHITHRFGVQRLPSPYDLMTYKQFRDDVRIISYAEEDGLETLICTIDHESRRPDGGTYHITWSLDREKGKKPVDSNRLIASGEGRVMIPVYENIQVIFDYLD